MVDLTKRQREILTLLISDYIASASAIGSRTLSKRHPGRLSPATIRNVMADLTDLGFLTQPHTSAGRLPTVEGLRYYVDTLLQAPELSVKEQALIAARCQEGRGSLQDFLQSTSSVLSSLSHYAGLVVTPGVEEIAFKHVEFLQLAAGRILGIFVSQGGLVKNVIIESAEPFTYAELEKINNFCNRALVGLNLEQARDKIRAEREIVRAEYDRLLKKALEFSDLLLHAVPALDLVVEGEAHLLRHEEYAEIDQLQKLLDALEEKEKLLKLLGQCRDSAGVKIYIGADREADEQALPASIISAPYRKQGRVVGMLGVIGPKRMDYSHVVPLVDFTAKLVSDYLETH